MAKYDWVKLQAEFTKAHAETGIKVNEWCESKGINYSSARRYIKITKAKAKVKTQVKARAMAENKNLGALKHGGYSKYFNTDITALVSDTDLTDELALCRSRIHLVVCTIEEIQRRLEQRPRVEADIAASLFDSLLKADIALDRNVARAESITKTLSSIRLDDLNEYKIMADTARSIQITKATVINAKKSIAQTELVELQIKKAEKEMGGTSKLDKYIDSLTGNGVDVVVG
jgi:hypothetical protein